MRAKTRITQCRSRAEQVVPNEGSYGMIPKPSGTQRIPKYSPNIYIGRAIIVRTGQLDKCLPIEGLGFFSV